MESNTQPISKRLDEIQSRLSDLRKKDKKLKLFGASQHKYILNPPLLDSAIDLFEKKHGVPLPAEYRMFVTKIGDGGAGPYYGLRRLEDFAAHWSHHGTNLSASVLKKPFPHQYWLNEQETRITKAMVKKSANGSISICEEGCGYNHLLIVCGGEQGNVWFDGCVSDQGMAPFRTEEKLRFSFLDWYESWLDMALSGK